MKKFATRMAFLIIMIGLAASPTYAARLLIPGGQVIGMELQDNTVSVVSFDETLGAAARAAGLKQGDRILRIDDTQIRSVEDVKNALAKSDGDVSVSVLRGEKTRLLKLCPTATADGPKLGVSLRQGTSGLGTVTYYSPDSDSFGALGHGVNDRSGNLLSLTRGRIYPARIESVKIGKTGAPGQLMGMVTQPDPLGSIEKNTAQGVFGTLKLEPKAEPLPVAQIDQVKTGAATIRSTVAGDTLREYSVEILKIYPNSASKTRNMLVKVTDPALLNATGGIVQGMSGSPIIQDGKLVGAVTHVLVNDPTTGYGIFIENMLDAAA